MDVKLKRIADNGDTSISVFYIDDVFQCFVIEDEYRTKRYMVRLGFQKELIVLILENLEDLLLDMIRSTKTITGCYVYIINRIGC